MTLARLIPILDTCGQVAIMFVYYEAGRLGLGKANPFNTMQQGRID